MRLYSLVFVLLLVVQDALGGDVSLIWDEVIDSRVALYEVYYGTSSGEYGTVVDSFTNSITITGLIKNETYYFAVKACSYDHIECSGYSNEVSTTISRSKSRHRK